MSLPPVSPSTLSGPGRVSTWPSKAEQGTPSTVNVRSKERCRLPHLSSPQLSKLKMKVHVHRDDAHFSYFDLCPF